MKLRTSHPAQRDYSIQALQQGMQVLDASLELRTSLSLEQVCAPTAVPESAAFRVIVKLLKDAGPAVWKRKADCLQMSSTTTYTPRQEAFSVLVSPLFTRFSRKADYIGLIRCLFEDAAWDVAANSCLRFRITYLA
jgi:hypothetical protein